MGTRNITIVQYDGEYPLAKYCQWDGYPAGQGQLIIEFLKNEFDREKFIKGLDNVWVPDEEEAAELTGIPPGQRWIDMDESKKMKERAPTLYRDVGGDILQYVQESVEDDYEYEGVPHTHSIGFTKESLFCEWAYVIDLDKNTLEVFHGFNNEPLPDDARFKLDEDEEPDTSVQGDTYYPVRLVEEFDLNKLPKTDEFVEWMNTELAERE